MKRTALLIVILFFLFSCDIFNPIKPDYSNKILFTSERSGKKQLYIVDPDGTNIEQITNGIFSHEWGRWSPNADKIVCTTSQWMTTAGMFMMTIKPNGLGGTLLSYGDSFEWHPDSNLIIYDFMPSAELGDLTINIYTEISQSVIIDNGLFSGLRDKTPAYSPDGRLIAFASNRDFINEWSSRNDLYIMNSDGSDQHRITYLDTFSTEFPYWSNDMSKIYFNSCGNICCIDLVDSSVTILCDSDEYAYLFPRLSPDNDKIIFIARVLDSSTKEYLFMSDIDGSNIHALIPDSTVSSCDWSK